MTLADLNGKPRRSRRSAKKAGAVYQELKRRITLGLMTSDSPITEQALAAEFNCSQGTVREALLALQECGLVERRGYQGTYVTETKPEEAALMADLRLRLETAGIRGAVAGMTDEHMGGLRDLAAQFDDTRANRDVFASAEIDRKLHMGLFRAAKMPILEPILKRTLLQLHRFLVSRMQTSFSYTAHDEASHANILDAIASGDAVQAEELLKRHIELTLINLAPEIHATVFPQAPLVDPALVRIRSA